MAKHRATRRGLIPVPLAQVRITGGFWETRLRTNREVTLPIEYRQCKKTGRIDAFRLDWKPGDPNPPHHFWDSDVAKWVEAASYSLTTHPDTRLARHLNDVVKLIAGAQQPDGYLNVHYTVVEPEKRWTNLRDNHELYCAGHLIEAAVAHEAATGDTVLLDAVCRYADHIATVFGKNGRRGCPGHEEIELALVKLYRRTGHRRHLELAATFLDERGRQPNVLDLEARKWGERPSETGRNAHDSRQAHLPVRKQRTAEGHAVRACYLYAGMAAVAAETGDRTLLTACRAIWRNITERRMYIHGGIGSTRFGERFTMDYDLPNETAYAETCAAIALVFFAHRMLQIERDSRYADVMERALYNCILSGVSLDGTRFFYDNLLASVPGMARFTGQKGPVRQQWFGCACCPPNLTRLLASLGLYMYSQTAATVYVHLFAHSRAEVQFRKKTVVIEQNTDYPWSGRVQVIVSPDKPGIFGIAIRIPGWCRKATLTVNGQAAATDTIDRKGYRIVRRLWKPGDRIDIDFAMPIEQIEAHPSARHNCGRVALQRGPVVYCLEECDNGRDLHDILLPEDAHLQTSEAGSGPLKGTPLIETQALRRRRSNWGSALYRAERTPLEPCHLTAIPYFMWANRGEGEMLVWLRRGSTPGCESKARAKH